MYFLVFVTYISITSNVKFTIDEVQLLFSLEFLQNAADVVLYTPVCRPIPTKKMRCVWKCSNEKKI